MVSWRQSINSKTVILCIWVAYSKFINYNVTRSEIVSDIFKLGHIEENRLKLNRFDKKYNLILQKSVNDIYYIYVVIFDLFKKNYNQIMEFKNLAINCDEDDDLIYSSLFLWIIHFYLKFFLLKRYLILFYVQLWEGQECFITRTS